MKASPARRSKARRSIAHAAIAAPADLAHPYFVLLDAMADGAVLLTADGAILFANRSFVSMAGASLETLRGSPIQQIASPADRAALEDFLREGHLDRTAREFCLMPATRPAVAVAITLSALPDDASLPGTGGEANLLLAIVTDLTRSNAAEATRRGLMTQLISAEADERRRVARELHDETGQSLTALLVGLRAIAEMSERPEVREAAMRLRDVAAQTIDDVGRLARGLHPAVLDDKGLGAAARRYAADYVRLYGTPIAFTGGTVDSSRLPPLTAGTMYRIIQETLTNIARHADATKITLKLKRSSSALELTVSDDGVGFDVRSANANPKGLGLRGMNERVELLGGTLRIESRPGGGTEIHARLPLAPRAAPTPRNRAGRAPQGRR
jgi:signal transduction histidine kinase